MSRATQSKNADAPIPTLAARPGQHLGDAEERDVIRAVREHGHVLLRGFASNGPEDFLRFGERFCSSFHNVASRTRTVPDARLPVARANGGNTDLPFHCEGYFYAPFELGAIMGVTVAAAGGETTFCDAVALWEALSSSTRDLFLRKRIKYRFEVPEETWSGRYKDKEEARTFFLSWESVKRFEFLPNNAYELESVLSAVRETPFTGQRAFLNGILAMAEYEGPRFSNASSVSFEDDLPVAAEVVREISARARELTIAYRLEPREVVVFDNLRVLHGRKRFEGDRELFTLFGRRNDRWNDLSASRA